MNVCNVALPHKLANPIVKQRVSDSVLNVTIVDETVPGLVFKCHQAIEAVTLASSFRISHHIFICVAIVVLSAVNRVLLSQIVT